MMMEFVQKCDEVSEWILKSNGLRVLTWPRRFQPSVAVMVTYLVGSRNESIGTTGATHFLEHMLFKGSKNVDPKKGRSIWTLLQRYGAEINATTSFDRTNFYTLCPNDEFAFTTALDIEADRMTGALLREEDRDSEKTVVENEFARGENDPTELIFKNLWATAYQALPYHTTTIGNREDIMNVPIERLREFYRRFYRPSNAYLILVGDFIESKMLRTVQRIFERVVEPASMSIPVIYTEEPAQLGTRRFDVCVPYKVAPKTWLAFRTPGSLTKERFALEILARLLAPSETSLLRQKLVPSFATDVSAFAEIHKDAGLFVIIVEHEEDDASMEKRILRFIKQHLSSVTNFETVRSSLIADDLYERDSSLTLASILNESIAEGDWKLALNKSQMFAKITFQDVISVASKLFQPNNMTVCKFRQSSQVPEKMLVGTKVELYPNETVVRAAGSEFRSRSPEKRFNIITARHIAWVQPETPFYYCRGQFRGVNDRMQAKAISWLCSKGLFTTSQYTTKRDLNAFIEESNLQFDCFTSTNNNFLYFQLKCRQILKSLVWSKFLKPLFKSFRTDDLQLWKTCETDEARIRWQDSSYVLSQHFQSLIWPNPNDPYHPFGSLEEELEAINKTVIETPIRLFSDCTLTLVESFANKTTTPKTNIDTSNKSKSAYKFAAPGPLSVTKRFELPNKSSISYQLQTPIYPITFKQYILLQLGVMALGEFFSSRLMTEVRDKRGLTYGANSRLHMDWNRMVAIISIHSTFSTTEKYEQGSTLITELVKQWIENGITKEELAFNKTAFLGQFKLAQASTVEMVNWSLDLFDAYPLNGGFHNLPVFQTNVENTTNNATLEEVNQTIKQCLRLDNFASAAVFTK